MRILKIISIVFISLLAVYYVTASIYIKQYLKKHAEDFTRRPTSIEGIYVNPLTGYLSIENIKISENNNDSIFISAKKLSLSIPLTGLIFKNYEIKDIKLESPYISIIKHENDFNFSDLFLNKDSVKTTKQKPKFTFSDINVSNGIITFRDTALSVYYKIKNVNLFSRGKEWDTDTISLRYSFDSGMISGSISGNYFIDLKTSKYKNNIKAVNYDFNIFDQYLADLTNYGRLRATLDGEVSSSGNLRDSTDFSIKAKIVVSDLHFGKDSMNDICGFDKLIYSINEISPWKRIYNIDTIVLIKPFIKYEVYDSLDIIETIALTGNKNNTASTGNRFNLIVEIAKRIKILSKNFFVSNYKINHIGILNGNFRLNDFSLNEKFSVALSPVTIIADSIHKERDKVNVSLKSEIQPYGITEVQASISPKDSGTFTMDYSFKNIPVAIGNPYAATYTSYSFDRGTSEFFGKWNVVKGNIKSKNHLIIRNVHVSENVKEKNSTRLPLPMLVSIIRDKDNVIDIEVPITGNLKQPDFHLSDVFMDILKNIFVKPLSDVYIVESKKEELKSEKVLSFYWPPGATELESSQIKFTKKLADFLVENAGETISVTPFQYYEREKERIIFFESKKKYFLNKKQSSIMTADDSVKISEMSIRNPLFLKYLSANVNDSLLFSLHDKCQYLIGEKIVDSKLKALAEKRKNNFLEYFVKNNTAKRVLFGKAVNHIPYNGFSFFQIKYEKDFPENVIKEYKKIQ